MSFPAKPRNLARRKSITIMRFRTDSRGALCRSAQNKMDGRSSRKQSVSLMFLLYNHGNRLYNHHIIYKHGGKQYG